MAKKTIGYVELAWTCPRCETENPGPRKFCTGCGAPQPDDVQFHQLENAVLLTEEADILRAKAGPDVHCPYCHARNPGDAEFCGACGGDLKDAEARESGQVIGAFRKNKGLERECPHCGTLNTSDALECSGCGASLAVRHEERTVEAPAASPSRSNLPKFAGIGCLAILLVGAAVLIFSLFRKEEMTATVRQVEWTYTIPILALTPVEQEAWYDEVPSEAESVSCSEELRERRDEAVQGALEVCGTPYTIDEGSGYGEVVQDCVYEVYDDYCEYTIMDWIEIDSVNASGNDLDPYWPVLNLQGDQQAGEGEAEYAVIFTSGNDSYRYYPDNEIEFSRYDRGSTWLIEVNQLGGVSVIEPAR